EAPLGARRARGDHLAHRRGPALLCDAARHQRRGRGVDDRQWLLPRGVQGTADGVRGGSAETARREPRRQRRLNGKGDHHMIKIHNLHATVDGKAILNGLDLEVADGEVHAIMGPNGSGKSTLAQVLAGRETFEVTEGSVDWDGTDLLALPAEERARAGLFLAFQYPVEIPGVSNAYFLKAAVNAIRRHRGLSEFDAMDFLAKVKAEMKAVGMKEEFLYRSVNEGFSGAEKKRNEVLQMALLEPKLAVLDETDSGLDI